jgi:hypothetical protein
MGKEAAGPAPKVEFHDPRIVLFCFCYARDELLCITGTDTSGEMPNLPRQVFPCTVCVS